MAAGDYRPRQAGEQLTETIRGYLLLDFIIFGYNENVRSYEKRVQLVRQTLRQLPGKDAILHTAAD